MELIGSSYKVLAGNLAYSLCYFYIKTLGSIESRTNCRTAQRQFLEGFYGKHQEFNISLQ